MKRTSLALLLVVAVITVGLLWSWRGSDPNTPVIDQEPGAPSQPSQQGSEALDAATNEQRSTAELPAGASSQPQNVPARSATEITLVSGRVLDTTGNPLAGVRIVLRGNPKEVVASSGTGGRFEFQLKPRTVFELAQQGFALELAPAQPWTAACGVPFTRDHCTDLLIVAAPSIELGGVVVDESGAEVAGATVWLTVRSTDLRDFPLPLDRSSQLDLNHKSDATGRFHLVGVPALVGCMLHADFEESQRGEIELPTSTRLDLSIVLRADPLETLQALSGIVQDEQGRPVEGAAVLFGSSKARSAADGRFELNLPDWIPEGLPLAASKKGFQACVVYDVDDRIARKDDSVLLLRLGPPCLEIRGRVLLADGKPAKGWTVTLTDGCEISRGMLPPTFAEALAAGASQGGYSRSTNREGEFSLNGLSARSYSVRAWDDDTLLALRATDVPAGTLDLMLRVPADAVWPEIRGQVVDRRGAPVAKCQVGIQLVTFRSGGGEVWQSSDGVSTTEDGRFLLKDVPKNEVRLAVSGDGVIGQSFEPAQLQLGSELRLVVDLRCHFRLLNDRHEQTADRASVLDERDEPLSVFTFQSGGWSSSSEILLHGAGATHAMAVSERARTLVVFQGKQEIARIPLNLASGQVSDVRY